MKRHLTSPLVFAAALGLCWAGWATHTLVDLQDRRIVTVALSELVGDFVAVEAKAGGSPDAAKRRTEAYLASLDRAVARLAEDGTTVLVAEAVVSKTAPDRTDRVRALIASDLAIDGEDR